MDHKPEKPQETQNVLRLIRITAATAMVLALVQYSWVFVEFHLYAEIVRPDKFRDFKEAVSRLLSDLGRPSVWFCIAGIGGWFGLPIAGNLSRQDPTADYPQASLS